MRRKVLWGLCGAVLAGASMVVAAAAPELALPAFGDVASTTATSG